jgi:hypothetical protein
MRCSIRSARATAALIAALTAATVPAQQPGAQSQGQGAGRVNQAQMTRMMQGWHPAAQEAMRMMAGKYGPPTEMTATMAMWGKTGPWKRTIVSSQAVQHAFPMPHPDVMEQVVDYRVPPEMVDDLAQYDGSVIVERTKGELSARCDKEGANFLALNLAHDIATGKRSVADARQHYAQQITAMKAERPAPYTERLMFAPMPNAEDPDRPVSAPGTSGGPR